MSKISELFKLYEGMTFEESTVEQRHEIWELLFNKNLLYSQADTVDLEHFSLGNKPFYFEDDEELFVPDFMGVDVVNIPFEEFKTRLSKL